MTSYREILSATTAILVCLPFISLLPISAEAQPLYLITMAAVISAARTVDAIYLSFVFAAFLISIYSLFIYDSYSVLESFVAYLVPLAVGLYVKAVDRDRFAINLSRFTIFYLFVACIQQFLPLGLSQILLGWLKALIPRLTLTPLTEWDRGISIVASEPSSMVPLIFLQLGMVYYLYSRSIFTGIRATNLTIVCVVLGLLTKAVTFYVAMAYLIISIFLIGLTRRSGVFLIYGALTVIFFFSGILELIVPDRAIDLINSFQLTHDFLIKLNNVSGNRIGVIFGPYCNLIDPNIYWLGFGAWSEQFNNVVSSCFPLNIHDTEYMRAVNHVNIKPSSIFALAMLDFGIFGIGFLVFFIGYSLLMLFHEEKRGSALGDSFFWASTAALVLGGFPLTLPHFWIVWFFFKPSFSRQHRFTSRTRRRGAITHGAAG